MPILLVRRIFLRILLLGDIYGRPGREMVREYLPEITTLYNPNFIVANGENSAGGFGITEKVAEELFGMGVNVITSGNHIWDKKEVYSYLDQEMRLLRPANYPPQVPGQYLYLTEVQGKSIAVINLIGRVFMGDYDCPFRRFDQVFAEINKETSIVIVDFHGEATSEKQAFAWYVDGRASVVVGTHTHVPTSDERILPRGTAYTTDLGMCGPLNGILGVDRDIVINRFLTQLPARFSVAKGPRQLCGVIVDIDVNGKAQKIFRIYYEKNIV